MSGLIPRQRTKHGQSRLMCWLESFLAAGSSALLLSVAHLRPEGWWVLLFALVPFLWRALGSSVLDNLVLGFLTAICFLVVCGQQAGLVGGQAVVWAIVWLGLTFAVFGLVYSQISRSVGLNPIFIASAWIPLEYALTSVGGFSCIIAIPLSDMNFLRQFSALFGLLAVSFVVILANSIILIFLRTAFRKLESAAAPATKRHHSERHLPEKAPLQSNRYSIPCGRAPPNVACLI